MTIWIAPYVLRPRAPLGSRARSGGRRGALLRVEGSGGGSGFADLHPWPELGDPDLDRQLAALRDGRRTAQVERSLVLAAEDAAARDEGRSLFDGLVVPTSHLLIPSLLDVDAASVAASVPVIKAKIGREPRGEVDAVARLDAALVGCVRWRLDANATLSPEELEAWLGDLRAHVGDVRLRAMIEYLEDPCPYDPEVWRRLRTDHGLGVALDREIGDASGAWTHRILKPAVQDPGPIARREVAAGRRLVVTSYLDHPVGQLHAARWAAEIARRHPGSTDVAGLLSQDAYERTAYAEALAVDGGRLRPPSGPGIGLEHLLEREAWRRLA